MGGEEKKSFVRTFALLGSPLTPHVNIRLGWRSLPVANTLAYLDNYQWQREFFLANTLAYLDFSLVVREKKVCNVVRSFPKIKTSIRIDRQKKTRFHRSAVEVDWKAAQLRRRQQLSLPPSPIFSRRNPAPRSAEVRHDGREASGPRSHFQFSLLHHILQNNGRGGRGLDKAVSAPNSSNSSNKKMREGERERRGRVGGGGFARVWLSSLDYKVL